MRSGGLSLLVCPLSEPSLIESEAEWLLRRTGELACEIIRISEAYTINIISSRPWHCAQVCLSYVHADTRNAKQRRLFIVFYVCSVPVRVIHSLHWNMFIYSRRHHIPNNSVEPRCSHAFILLWTDSDKSYTLQCPFKHWCWTSTTGKSVACSSERLDYASSCSQYVTWGRTHEEAMTHQSTCVFFKRIRMNDVVTTLVPLASIIGVNHFRFKCMIAAKFGTVTRSIAPLSYTILHWNQQSSIVWWSEHSVTWQCGNIDVFQFAVSSSAPE